MSLCDLDWRVAPGSLAIRKLTPARGSAEKACIVGDDAAHAEIAEAHHLFRSSSSSTGRTAFLRRLFPQMIFDQISAAGKRSEMLIID
jgi:hypothetical protein